MTSKFLFLTLILYCLNSFAINKSARLTPFQKNIQNCLQDKIDVKPLSSLQKLMALISKKYILLSSEILGREVLYKDKNETRKLRYENGQVRLSKILEDEDGRSVPVDNEVRQKSLTDESYMAQLLIHADIRSDWMKVSEKRSGSTFVTMTTADDEIKSLLIEKKALQKKLDCTRTDGVESCSCTDTK